MHWWSQFISRLLLNAGFMCRRHINECCIMSTLEQTEIWSLTKEQYKYEILAFNEIFYLHACENCIFS